MKISKRSTSAVPFPIKRMFSSCQKGMTGCQIVRMLFALCTVLRWEVYHTWDFIGEPIYKESAGAVKGYTYLPQNVVGIPQEWARILRGPTPSFVVSLCHRKNDITIFAVFIIISRIDIRCFIIPNDSSKASRLIDLHSSELYSMI